MIEICKYILFNENISVIVNENKSLLFYFPIHGRRSMSADCDLMITIIDLAMKIV